MIRHIDVRPAADLDVDSYFYFIGMDNESVAHRFLDAVSATYAKIGAWPGMGHPREFANPSLIGIRSIAIEGFPNHLVFYRVVDDGTIRILRIRHGAMDADAIEMGE